MGCFLVRSFIGDVTDVQDGAQDDSAAEVQGSDIEDRASESDSDQCAAAELEEDIVDETLDPSPMKDRTRKQPIKGRALVHQWRH